MRKNDPSRLKDTIDKFASFLDTLAKQPSLSIEAKIFLAQGFASLDNPIRGVDLLVSIKPPTEKDPGKPPAALADSASDADRAKYDEAKSKFEAAKQIHDQAWKTYWFAQLTHERELRQLGRQETGDAAKSKAFSAAGKMIDEMIGTPQKQGWGFNSLEVRRERAFLLEDQGRYQDALQLWTANQRPFLKQMQERMAELESLKRVNPETMEREAELVAARLNQADKDVLASRRNQAK